MPVILKHDTDDKFLFVQVSDKLKKEDYEQLAPQIEELIDRHGKIRVLVQTMDFHGWNAGALWEDIKFSAKHFNDIERVAIVGEKKWEKGMATFCKPFTTAKVKYFDHSQLSEARLWITE